MTRWMRTAAGPYVSSEPYSSPVTIPPPSGNAYFAEKFDNGVKHGANGWSWHATGSQVTLQAIAGPFGGDTHALRFRWGPGLSDTVEQRFTMGPNLLGYWFGMYMLYPLNYLHDGPVYNKLWRAWGGRTGDLNNGYRWYDIKGGFSTMPNSPGTSQSRIRPEFGYRDGPGDLDNSGVGDFQYNPTGNVIGTANTPLGEWMHVIGHVQLSSDFGVSDGILTLKLNGTTVFHAANVDWYERYTVGVKHYFDYGYILGAANSGYAAQTDIHVTRIRFAPDEAGADPDNAGGWET